MPALCYRHQAGFAVALPDLVALVDAAVDWQDVAAGLQAAGLAPATSVAAVYHHVIAVPVFAVAPVAVAAGLVAAALGGLHLAFDLRAFVAVRHLFAVAVARLSVLAQLSAYCPLAVACVRSAGPCSCLYVFYRLFQGFAN